MVWMMREAPLMVWMMAAPLMRAAPLMMEAPLMREAPLMAQMPTALPAIPPRRHKRKGHPCCRHRLQGCRAVPRPPAA